MPVPVPARWVSVRHLQRAVTCLAQRGVDTTALLNQAGLSPSVLDDADGRVDLAALEHLLHVVERDLRIPHLGLELAQSITPAAFGVLGHLFQACGTLQDLLGTMVRFNGLMSNLGHSSMRHGPGTVTMSWSCLAGGEAFAQVAAEFILGACSVMTRTLAPGLPRPVVVRFRHAGPHAQAMERLVQHFDCPVHMQQPDNAIVIPLASLNRRLPYGDIELKALLEQRAQSLLAARQQRTCFADDVRRQISLTMARGSPAPRVEVARRLGLSESTLHRRLRDVGQHYQSLVDAVRLQMATQSLAQGCMSTSLTAQRLGFSSPQVFARWFRLHTGLTPGQYREQAGRKSDE